ncbi:hypothetical protein C0995_012170 [Termitomyces sp. Mi166|nr:hypothetical protein C0995_012170 [Termitomyces sp. Mi166\
MDMKWLFYTFIGVIADTLDGILTYLMPDRRPQRSVAAKCMRLQPSDVDHLSDEEIANLWRNAPKLNPPNKDGPAFSDSLKKLTPNTVAKPAQDFDDDVDSAEANVLDFVFAETTIPVPRVRRVVKMSFVLYSWPNPGSSLASSFNSAKNLHCFYVASLRSLASSPEKCHNAAIP